MKAKIAIAVVAILLVGGGIGFYFYYQNHLRFTDAFTDCPVAQLREAAPSPAEALEMVDEEFLGSLAVAERCGLDCRHGNHMACVVYGAALHGGVFVMRSEDEASEAFDKACARGVALGCDLEQRSRELVEERERRAEAEKAREASREVLRAIDRKRTELGRLIKEALDHFDGSEGPMRSARMLKWHRGTIEYLLYGKPMLSRMNRKGAGDEKEKLGLEEFVLATYMSGEAKPDFEPISAFFDKLLRLGAAQIKLDYRVEKKKESQIPERNGYWRAKHTFLYNAAETYMDILDLLEKEIRHDFEPS